MSVDENYLSQLNEPQRRAVEYLGGASLVIAGAGSGKTRVLTYKIVHLLRNGFEPYRILALTFTNKAAKEMRERIEQLVETSVASKIWMGTFHSIFLRILRQNADRIGFRRDFTIYDAADSKALIKTIIKDMGLDDKIYKASTVQNAISMAKNALISPDQYGANRDLMEADRRGRKGEIVNIYRAYRQRCHIAQAMDFDDILYYTNVLLRDNDDVRAHYREFFKYILVDEYQDTNFAQHLIVAQLTNAEENFCVVGDDAQSIYSFRGANIKNILNLRKNYPRLEIFKLEQNYRSTQNIINAANSLIEKNVHQIPKRVFSRNDVGAPVDIVKNYSDLIESVTVAARISQLRMQTGDSFEDFAVLYRTNAQSRILEESLRKQNIPYRIYGGLSFYQRKEVKDAISYFRLSVNPDDDEALRRIINTPGRGIGETTVNKLVKAAIDNRVSVWNILQRLDEGLVSVNSGSRRKLESFRDMIVGFVRLNDERMRADELAVVIIRQSQLLSSLLHDNTPENISRQENIQEVLNGVKEYVGDRMEDGSAEENPAVVLMGAYLAQVSLLTDQDQKDTDAQAEERVTLMTVHAAKGLEFNNVIIVGAEEELFPSAMSSGSLSEIEEERRLMYVAITRAKNYCMISYAESRYRNGQTVLAQPSRFIREIDSRYLRHPLGNNTFNGRPSVNPADRYRESFHSNPFGGFSDRSSGNSTGRSAVEAYNEKVSPRRVSAAPGFPSSTSGSSCSRSCAPGKLLQSQGENASTPGNYGLHAASELTSGKRIRHERFGYGKILEVDTSGVNARIIVAFDSLDTKTLLLKFARFEIIEDTRQ